MLAALVLAPAASAGPTSLSLSGPAAVDYGRTIELRGRVTPAEGGVLVSLLRDGAVVARTLTYRDGTYGFRARVDRPVRFEARAGSVSTPFVPRVRPLLTTRILGSRAVGRPLRFVARLRPAHAGMIVVRVIRNGRVTLIKSFSRRAAVGLRTRRPGSVRVRVTIEPADGWTGRRRLLRATVVLPRLGLGARGASVLGLEQRLRELGFALPRVDRYYGFDTYQAVLAFQKLRGLARTGRVDAGVWRTLTQLGTVMPRYRGTHVEVSKSRQVLFLVRNSRVELIVHVSTGATGNTPIGHWRVYRKNVGWDWVLWYPMYFLRGFAIHGYPSVPAYPASHGCVRVPMWVAPRLFSSVRYGESIYVY
jgi:hypothetical protein